MTTLYNGLAQKQTEMVYNKVLNASLEVLCEFTVSTILGQPLDRVQWGRKVFKVYKTMKELERKKNSQPFFCKRLFKLVFVLFKLKKGLNVDEIWRQLQTQIDTDDDGYKGDGS